jgi:hypothetical protein
MGFQKKSLMEIIRIRSLSREIGASGMRRRRNETRYEYRIYFGLTRGYGYSSGWFHGIPPSGERCRGAYERVS